MRLWLVMAVLVAVLGEASSQTVPGRPEAPTAPTRTEAPAGREVSDPAQGPEKVLFEAANRARRAKGLKPLAWSSQLASAARGHAQRMARENQLSHQFPGQPDFASRIRGTGLRFRSVAENVAQGPEAAGIHTQWMNSQPHRSNLLDPAFDSIGIGVAERQGQLFAVQDFAQRAE